MAVFNGKIGFIGGGNMAEAIAGALIRTGFCPPSRLLASDISPERLEYLKKTYDINTLTDNKELVMTCDVVVLAIKPQVMEAVLLPLAELIHDIGDPEFRRLFISVAAGIPLERLEKGLYARIDEKTASRLPIVRVMPNTPALVMAGMSGVSVNRYVTSDDKALAMDMLAATGKVLEFDESLLNAVTAVSGSGPAYVFYLVESMIKAGVALGLSETDASTLTLQTVKGALKLLEEGAVSPAELRRRVTSPGGTTEAAIAVMEKENVQKHIITALTAACRRAQDLCG